MRRYDEPVEVRKGQVGWAMDAVEGPEQFLWRGSLWKVREVVAHWRETGPWWHGAGANAVLGLDEPGCGESGLEVVPTDLLVERDLWRVEAARPGAGARASVSPGRGVFDLSFSFDDGCWRLVGCLD